MTRPKPADGPNAKAMRTTIAALKATGKLEQADEAIVAAALSLAKAVDADPGNAALWREYRATEQRLRSSSSGDVDEFDALAADMRAAMGDTAIP